MTQSVWKRGLMMLLFLAAFSLAHAVLNVTTVVQFVWLLFAREPNRFLMFFGMTLSLWLGEVARFLTCASEEKPFPWKDWPHAEPPAA